MSFRRLLFWTWVGCFPPRANNQASSNVIVNGIGAHREGDSWSVHCCGPSCHASSLAKGSNTVIVNGKGVGRITDPVACGSTVVQGSINVLAG